MAASVRDGGQGARSRPVFTEDQCDDLKEALGDAYARLLPILEQAVTGYRANQALPSHDDTVRTHVQAAEKLAAPCRRFLRDLEKVTPSWREAQRWSFGPPLTPAKLDERMSLLIQSRSAVERLLEETRMWEEIGQRRGRLKRVCQT